LKIHKISLDFIFIRLYNTHQRIKIHIPVQGGNSVRTKIRHSGARIRIIAALCCAVLLCLGGGAAFGSPDNAAGYAGGPVEVYGGGVKIDLVNLPFTADGDYYLPLRETLYAFGISGVTWNDGHIHIPLGAEVSEAFDLTVTRIKSVGFYIGGRAVTFAEERLHSGRSARLFADGRSEQTLNLRNPPVLRDGVAFMPLDFFEHLQHRGHISVFALRHERSKNPRDYVVPGEDYFIGTGREHDRFFPVDENGSERLVRRIIVDEAGEAVAVIPVEHQKPAAIRSAEGKIFTQKITAVFYNGFERLSGQSGGKSLEWFVQKPNWSGGRMIMETVAYIPPVYQINGFAAD
jgi:hypothetical protein